MEEDQSEAVSPPLLMLRPVQLPPLLLLLLLPCYFSLVLTPLLMNAHTSHCIHGAPLALSVARAVMMGSVNMIVMVLLE